MKKLNKKLIKRFSVHKYVSGCRPIVANSHAYARTLYIYIQGTLYLLVKVFSIRNRVYANIAMETEVNTYWRQPVLCLKQILRPEECLQA